MASVFKISFSLLFLLLLLSLNPAFSQTKNTKSNLKIQTTALSVCEVLKNRKNFAGKEIIVTAVLTIDYHTSTFHPEKNCMFYESIAVGEDESFQSANNDKMLTDFESARNLIFTSRDPKVDSHSWVLNHAVKIRLITKGKFFTSKKGKWGMSKEYRHLFLITKIEQIVAAKVIGMEDYFKDDL